MNTLHERISLVVNESGLTKTEFGKRVNLSQTTISNLTNGKQNPSDRTIIDIADKFGINEEWLRTGSGPMRIHKSREEDLTEFFGELLNDDIPDRREIILALSRMPAEWWKAIADMIFSAADALRKDESPDPDE